PGAPPRPAAAGATACAPGAPSPPRPPAEGAPAPPGPAGAAPRAPPPPAPIFMRPTSPLHTAAFQVGFTSQPSTSAIPPLITIKESGTPPTEPSLSWNTEDL